MDTEYKKIIGSINYLNDIKVLDQMATNCQVACDILQSLLNSQNIESEIIEVVAVLSTFKNEIDNSHFVVVGLDNKNIAENQVDSHFVLLTKTSTPYLIDISISNLLDEGTKFIVTEVPLLRTSKKIVSVDCDKINISYFDKNVPRDIKAYSNSVSNRIVNEIKFNKSYNFLKKIVLIACILGLINFSLNIIILILKVLNP